MSVTVDVSGLDDLVASLESVDVIAAVKPVASKAALEVKNSMRSDADGHFWFPGVPYSVSYDIEESGSSVTAIIGPARSGPGKLAFFWLGNARHAPSAPDPVRYGDREAGLSVKFIAEAIGKALQ